MAIQINAGSSPSLKVIWNGEWSSGTIDVPEINNYTLFIVNLATLGTSILAVRRSSYLRGIGGYSTGSDADNIYTFAATVDGTTLTYVNSKKYDSTTKYAVASIIGVI